jgi:hypothetical protein
MTRKLIYATLLFLLTAAFALNAVHKTELAVVNAHPETSIATTPTTAFGVCDFSYVRNVKIRALGKSDFEVTWEFGTPDICLQAQSFTVEVRAKRNLGGNLLGRETINVSGGERRAIAKFRSIAGIDKVETTVVAVVTLKPFAQSFLNL